MENNYINPVMINFFGISQKTDMILSGVLLQNFYQSVLKKQTKTKHFIKNKTRFLWIGFIQFFNIIKKTGYLVGLSRN